MLSPFISVICFRKEGAIFFPLEPKKQRSSQRKKNNAWSQVKTLLDSFTWGEYVHDYVPTRKDIRRSMNTYPI